VGNGSATKSQVQYMVKQILKMQTIPKPDDAADALAVAICYLHTTNFERAAAR
jgi:crossover junction endodeoxyribonuclease RuvC